MRTIVELPDALRARLLELASRRGSRGVSAIIEEALERYLDDEDLRRWRAEEARALIGTLSEQDAWDLEASIRYPGGRWR